jgi:hypothetical protein
VTIEKYKEGDGKQLGTDIPVCKSQGHGKDDKYEGDFIMFRLTPDKVIKNGHGKKQQGSSQKDKQLETSHFLAKCQQYLRQPAGIDILKAAEGMGKEIMAYNSPFFYHYLAEFNVIAKVIGSYITHQAEDGCQPEGKDIIDGFQSEDGGYLLGFHISRSQLVVVRYPLFGHRGYASYVGLCLLSQ